MIKPFVIYQTPQGSARCCDCLFAAFDRPPEIVCEHLAHSALHGEEFDLVPVLFYWSCRFFTPASYDGPFDD